MAAATGARTRWTFAVGTLGRDMVYTLVSMFLLVFLTEVLDLPDATMWWVSGVMLVIRLLDAVDDFFLGAFIDNTRTRWGPYKPWIAAGTLGTAVFTVVLFTDTGLRGPGFVVGFGLAFLLWGIAWTVNDIPYWSLIPALTLDQRMRERIAALAKVFATIGLFSVAVLVIPVTTALGGDARAWTLFAAGVASLMVIGQIITLVGVRQPRLTVDQERTTLREIWSVVTRNDQLLWTACSMILFMTGYITTTSFGVYFFTYAYGDAAMYTPFAAILGFAQMLGFVLFPFVRGRTSRRTLFTGAIGVISLGYVIFFFSPMNMIPIGIAGILMFAGQSFVVVLMLGFVTDCIDYGHWKLGRRNNAVSFALQPFINKAGGAFATALTSVTLILTGINEARGPADVTEGGLWGMRIMMFVVPLLLVLSSYVVYRLRYRIDEELHARILADLGRRGQIVDP